MAEIGAVHSRLHLDPEAGRRVEEAVAPAIVEAALEEADVAFLAGDPGLDVAAAPSLRWVHVTHAGLDGGAVGPLLDAGVRVTTGAGRSAEALAEQAVAFLLALSGEHDRLRRAQRWRVWGPPGLEQRLTLRGRTLLVVGSGHTGQAVARLGDALGMRVLGHRRKDLPAEPPFERVTSADRGEPVDTLLAEADAVVLAASLNDGSRHLIGPSQLAALPPGALLVNVARGGLVDERALVDALRRGHLAGAATDVVEGEPLSVRSPLWRAPNLLVSPHRTPRLPDWDERTLAILLDNVARYRADQPLRNELGPDDVYTGPPMRRTTDLSRWWRRAVRRFL
jgi:phosphoglycerate dehydrogenase-like enzyme